MPINPALLARGVQGVDTAGAYTAAANLIAQQNQNALFPYIKQQEQIKASEAQKNVPGQDMKRALEMDEGEFQSIANGAESVFPYIKQDDWAGASDALTERIAELKNRGIPVTKMGHTLEARKSVDEILLLESQLANSQDPQEQAAISAQLQSMKKQALEETQQVIQAGRERLRVRESGNTDSLLKTVEREDGKTVNIYRSGKHEVTDTVAARPDFRYEVVKSFDKEGNEVTRIFRLDTTNRPEADGSLTPIQTRVPVETQDPDKFLSRLPQENVTYSNGAGQQPVTQSPGVTTVTSPVEGLAAQESAKSGAKLTEERFAKVITDAPQHTKMAGFIRQVSSSVLRAASKVKKIIQENPNTAIGFGSQFSVQRTADGGTKQVNLPGSWDEAAIEVDTLMNQVFGGAAFATLQQMRQASPTGGALGQVSNFEIDLLQNQWSAFSQRTGDPAFAIGQMDEMIEQARLVADLANVEIGVQQRIQGLGPKATKEEIANLINAGFKNMADVYKRHGRDAGVWDNETLIWTPSRDLVSGDSNVGKKEVLDLTQDSGGESIDDILARNQ